MKRYFAVAIIVLGALAITTPAWAHGGDDSPQHDPKAQADDYRVNRDCKIDFRYQRLTQAMVFTFTVTDSGGVHHFAATLNGKGHYVIDYKVQGPVTLYVSWGNGYTFGPDSPRENEGRNCKPCRTTTTTSSVPSSTLPGSTTTTPETTSTTFVRITTTTISLTTTSVPRTSSTLITTITIPRGELPRTGSNSELLVGVGLLLVAFGIALARSNKYNGLSN